MDDLKANLEVLDLTPRGSRSWRDAFGWELFSALHFFNMRGMGQRGADGKEIIDPSAESIFDLLFDARRDAIPWSFCMAEYHRICLLMTPKAKRVPGEVGDLLDELFEGYFVKYLQWVLESIDARGH